MPAKTNHFSNTKGLSEAEVVLLRKQYGKNNFHLETSRSFFRIAWDIIKEPMFILLIVACSLYFVLHDIREGFLMLVAMVFVAAISFYQEIRSSNALEALKQFTAPRIPVIRNDKTTEVAAEDLVPGDIILLEEGMTIPADAVILQQNDLSVNESVITGESMPADKSETEGKNILYQGSTINSGKCIAQVSATGNNTVLGKLGKQVSTYHPEKTILQLQINRFVTSLALFGLLGFIIIFFVNYIHNGSWINSLLFGLTIAMSAIPEEIPVAFSSFMALGAYKMSRLGIILRQPQVVENLGAVSVICFDKTGTLTENKMKVTSIYDYENDTLIDLNANSHLENENILRFAALASETDPFDAMEQAIWEAYDLYSDKKIRGEFMMIYEYPLQGRPPMMTHVYQYNNLKIVAGKGALERIIAICNLRDNDKNKIANQGKFLAMHGYRVIAVASAVHNNIDFPISQDDFNWHFEGLLALYDPPRKGLDKIIGQFYDANIRVKLITGDYPETAINIAGKVGIPDYQKCIGGDEVMRVGKEELMTLVKTTNVFARMFPDAKLKVIDALKSNGEIVAMTGDGINDGPALKSANIGIAMGRKGTEIARIASDLILTDDDIKSIITAIREGRKIFSNFKKAIRYIISIHIPIIATASLPVILGWAYPNIFTPIHIIFMELIMGPTCSIFYEKEPVQGNIMLQKPRKTNTGLFSGNELIVSILQGCIIGTGTLMMYYYFMTHDATLQQTRNLVFTTLIMSNIFLTFSNRSFSENIFYTMRYKNKLTPLIIIISLFFLAILQLIPFIQNLFEVSPITFNQFFICVFISFISVIWIEVYKFFIKKKLNYSFTFPL